MKIPVAFDPNNLNSGKGVRRGTISVVTNNTPDQNLEVTWYTSLDSGDNLILTNDSFTLDKQPDPGLATPLFWPTARDSASFLETINGLPRSPKNITDMGTAWEYLASNNYFILDPNNPLPNIVTDGLVLDIEANQPTSYPTTGSTIYDLSGVENNGTLVNGPTFNTNGWFDFDGTDDEIIVADDSTLDLTTDMSFEFLFKASSSQNNLYPRLIDKSSWLVHILQTPPFGIYQNVNTSAGLRQTGTTSNIIQADTWTHVISNYDGQIGKIYINGNLVRTQDFGSELPCTVNGTVVTIGGNTGTDRQLNGSIAKTKIYNKALSESEVSQNYYQAPIVTDGLVLAVDAGNLVSYESGSTTAYSLTGSLSGSLVNGTGYLPDNGGIWDFDGTNDQINFGNQSSLGFTNGVFSVEAWIYIPSSWTGGSQYPNLVSKGGSAGWDTDGWSLFGFRNYGSGTGYAVGIGLRNSGAVRITLSYNQPADTWLHVVGTLDGSSIKIYVNGILKTSNTQDVNPGNNNTNVYIGRDPSSQYFPGKIAGSRLYNKTLTAAEVSQNYNAQSSRFI
jgi:hypothetical protein